MPIMAAMTIRLFIKIIIISARAYESAGATKARAGTDDVRDDTQNENMRAARKAY